MKLCVALDLPTESENLELVKKLKSEDIWFKVGLRSFIRDGEPLLKEIKNINPDCKIFLDLKIYDIPNTMADAAESMVSLGVDMFNVHATSGVKAMSMVMNRIKDAKNRPLVLAVTALTSFDDDSFRAIYNESIAKKAVDFAKDSHKAGLDGVVCSVFESIDIKNETKSDFLTLTPGIRPFGEKSDDQERVANLVVAKENLSDFIVVGRPIYHSADPLGVVRKIIQESKLL